MSDCSSKDYDSLRLSRQVCFPLYACAKEIVRQYAPLLKKLDLTYTQYLVMMVMWEQICVSSKQLSALLHLDSGTLTPVLKRLEANDYIKRERTKDDERLLTLTLTKKGESLKDKALTIPQAMAGCVGLNKDELETLYNLTYKALASMEAKP